MNKEAEVNLIKMKTDETNQNIEKYKARSGPSLFVS